MVDDTTLAGSTAQPSATRFGLALLATLTTARFLLQVGGSDLAVPVTSVGDLRIWIETTAPDTITLAVLRVAALGACGYLTIALLIGGMVATTGSVLGRRHGTRLVPAFLRHLLVGSASLSLASTALPVSTATAGVDLPAPTDDETAVMTKLAPEDEAAPSTTTTTPLPETSPTTTSPTTTPPTTTPPTTSLPDLEPAPPDTTEFDEVAPADTWVVAPGDSFWSIAEEIVAERASADGDPPPSDAVIGRYWLDLITANREMLAHPDEPDLLFSGQELRLPPADA